MERDTLLAYYNLNTQFGIHKNASDYLLSVVIIQEGKLIELLSRNLIVLQTRYTIKEKLLLSMVETLTEFQTIVLDQQLKIYTN